MIDSNENIHVDSWCVTKVKAIETKYQWIIENVDRCMKKPLDLKSGTFTSMFPDDKVIEWQLKLTFKVKTDHLSISLRRLDNFKDISPVVKARFMIINSNQQVEHTADAIEESTIEKEIEIPNFIKTNNTMLKKNQNIYIICCLKIGLNSIKTFSNEENSIELSMEVDHISDVINDFQKLIGNENMSDCTLICHSRKFYVQKAILTARSSYFFNEFKNKQGTNEGMEVCDLSLLLTSDILIELLSFIYTGNLQNIEKSTEDLLKAAHAFGVPSMKKICAIYLGKKLSIDNAIEMLRLSISCDTVHLKQQVADFMIVHAKNIINSESFSKVGSFPDEDREVIIRILLHKVE